MQEPTGQQPPIPPVGGYSTQPSSGSSNKLAAGLCGIFLGQLGIHKFILGYTTEGAIMLICTLVLSWFTCGIAGGIVWTIGLIEGIIYLSKSDQEFEQTYVQNKRPWF